jgi:hypothetical protein
MAGYAIESPNFMPIPDANSQKIGTNVPKLLGHICPVIGTHIDLCYGLVGGQKPMNYQ